MFHGVNWRNIVKILSPLSSCYIVSPIYTKINLSGRKISRLPKNKLKNSIKLRMKSIKILLYLDKTHSEFNSRSWPKLFLTIVKNFLNRRIQDKTEFMMQFRHPLKLIIKTLNNTKQSKTINRRKINHLTKVNHP